MFALERVFAVVGALVCGVSGGVALFYSVCYVQRWWEWRQERRQTR